MKAALVLGIALVFIGAAVLGYDHYSYTTNEEVLKIGPITATAERTHTLPLSPLLGWLLMAGGAGVIAFAAMSKKR